MLLLDITTFELENSAKVFKRWEQAKDMVSPKGLKVVNQWFDAGGGRIITVYDVESVKDYVAHNYLFTDLCQIEVFPIVGAEEFKKYAFKCMESSSAENSTLDV